MEYIILRGRDRPTTNYSFYSDETIGSENIHFFPSIENKSTIKLEHDKSGKSKRVSPTYEDAYKTKSLSGVLFFLFVTK